MERVGHPPCLEAPTEPRACGFVLPSLPLLTPGRGLGGMWSQLPRPAGSVPRAGELGCRGSHIPSAPMGLVSIVRGLWPHISEQSSLPWEPGASRPWPPGFCGFCGPFLPGRVDSQMAALGLQAPPGLWGDCLPVKFHPLRVSCYW